MPSTRRAVLAEYLDGKVKVEDIANTTKMSTGQVSELLQDLEL
jgi:predicted Rossmann fold nucleotide-binding protein DprA/Smf involved in DNA uptake